MMRFSIQRQARQELTEAAEFLERQEEGLGDAFLAELSQTIDRARTAPQSGTPVEGKVRRLSMRRFRYSVIYLIRDRSILIIAVMHQHRRPGYWRSRLR